MEDKRFAHISNDPKFRRIPKNEKKVKIDKRFQSMFNDKKFKIKYTTDRRGKPVSHTSTEDLKRYYDLSSEESSDDLEDEEPKAGKFVLAPKSDSDSEISNDLQQKSNIDKTITNEIKSKLKNLNVDYARGESALYSDSSSDDDSDSEDNAEIDDIDHKWGELDADAAETEEASYRLAVCNMDWDRIRAVDLMVLFNSFLPAGGIINSVTIYPSEYGIARMAEEEIKGPIELLQENNDKKDNEETEEGSKYHMEKLRQYQLNRLKYFYAVVVFDNANTANKIYTECDGMEYESSATKMDLRFIPDEMSFDSEPKETCEKLPELNKYEPRFFTTTALQQAKVDLTWDETNPERIEIAQKINNGKVDDISEGDLQNYLAGSSDEDSDIEENEDDLAEEGECSIGKYKALLQDIEEKDNKKKNKDVEMEVTWGLGLKDDAQKMVKRVIEKTEEKTPFQQYLDKRKEKRKEKKEKRKKQDVSDDNNSDVPSDIDLNDSYFAEEFNKPEFKQSNKKLTRQIDNENNDELELLLMNQDDGKKHFSLKKIQDEENETKSKKKQKNKKVNQEEVKDEFNINVNDGRFSALFTSHHYNIDPTDPHFKKTKGMDKLISEKLKRRNEENVDDNKNKKLKMEKNKDVELSILVKSVKRKTESLKRK